MAMLLCAPAPAPAPASAPTLRRTTRRGLPSHPRAHAARKPTDKPGYWGGGQRTKKGKPHHREHVRAIVAEFLNDHAPAAVRGASHGVFRPSPRRGRNDEADSSFAPLPQRLDSGAVLGKATRVTGPCQAWPRARGDRASRWLDSRQDDGGACPRLKSPKRGMETRSGALSTGDPREVTLAGTCGAHAHRRRMFCSTSIRSWA